MIQTAVVTFDEREQFLRNHGYQREEGELIHTISWFDDRDQMHIEIYVDHLCLAIAQLDPWMRVSPRNTEDWFPYFNAIISALSEVLIGKICANEVMPPYYKRFHQDDEVDYWLKTMIVDEFLESIFGHSYVAETRRQTAYPAVQRLLMRHVIT